MNQTGSTFGDTAGWLADYLADLVPDVAVDTRFPDAESPPTRWVAVRDDGTTRASVATGIFSGGLTCRGRTEDDTKALAKKVAEIIEATPLDPTTPVVAVPDMQWPWPLQDDTYGVLGYMPLSLTIIAQQITP